MLIFPALFRLASYIQVKAVTPIINPIPYLVNDATPAIAAVKHRFLHHRSLSEQTIIVPETGHQQLVVRELASYLYKSLKHSFVILEVRQSIVHADDRVEISARYLAQIPHVCYE